MPCGLGGESDEFVKMAEKVRCFLQMILFIKHTDTKHTHTQVLSGKIQSKRVLTKRDVNMLTRTIDCLNRLSRRRGVGDRPFEETDLEEDIYDVEEEARKQKKMEERM